MKNTIIQSRKQITKSKAMELGLTEVEMLGWVSDQPLEPGCWRVGPAFSRFALRLPSAT